MSTSKWIKKAEVDFLERWKQEREKQSIDELRERVKKWHDRHMQKAHSK